METGYIVREAAGDWWLVDIKQSGEPYKKPKRVNRTAAEIVRLRNEGNSEDEIAEMLHERYGVDREDALSDVKQLLGSLGVS